MVSAVHGTLLECDIPTRVFILHLNDEQIPSERFVIQDLDETHLLVQPHKIEMVRGEVKKFQEKMILMRALGTCNSMIKEGKMNLLTGRAVDVEVHRRALTHTAH